MKSILIVPTYNYLCDPLINKVYELFGVNSEFHSIELVEPKASYGVSDFSNIPVVTSFKLKTKSLNGPHNILAKKKLLEHLNAIDPTYIITFSDVTSFANFVKGSKYESRVIVIQPCLLDMREISWKVYLLFLIRKLLDKLISRGGIKSSASWGETLLKATFLVWSNVEKKYLECKGRKAVVSGAELASFSKKRNLQKTNDVVVAAPHFNLYESQELINDYFSTLMEIVRKMPECNFKIKYHPANNVLMPDLLGVEVISELDDIRLEEAKYILCGYSNVAVTASFLNDKIFILDAMYYNNSYVNADNFFIIDKNDLSSFYNELDNNSYSGLTNCFVASDSFINWRDTVLNK